MCCRYLSYSCPEINTVSSNCGRPQRTTKCLAPCRDVGDAFQSQVFKRAVWSLRRPLNGTHVVRLFVCVCVCLFVCLFVCVFVCLFVCLFVSANALLWVDTLCAVYAEMAW